MSETAFEATTQLEEVHGDGTYAPVTSDFPARRPGSGTISRRAFWVRRITLGSDIVALGLAVGVAALLAAGLGRPALDGAEFLLFAALVPLWVLLANHVGLYRLPERTIDWSFADDLSSAFVVTSIWGWFWMIGRSAIESGAVAVLPSLTVWAVAIVTVPLLRSAVRSYMRKAPWYRQSVVLAGSSVGVDRVMRRIRRQPNWCFNVVETVRMDSRFDTVGGPARLLMAVRAQGVSRVIIAGGPVEIGERTKLIRDLLEMGLYVDCVSSEADAPSAFVDHLEGLPTLAFSPARLSPSSKLIKRTIDITCSSLMLLLLSPLLAYIAVRIKLDSSGPVLFRQQRAGLAGSRFKLVKFRTMVTDAEDRRSEVSDLRLHPDSAAFKAVEDPRVTRYGASLRRRSLDELPQLWNVLVGDMSLVGPRPLPLDEDAEVPPRYRARQTVRPGLTGPWQVLGRSDIPFEDMIKLDYMYVSTWSPRGDLKLLLTTIAVVFQARGAY